MASFYTKIVEFCNKVTTKDKNKPDYVKCDNFNKIAGKGCFGHHTPFIDPKCLKCISLDRYNWLYILIDNQLCTEEIDSIRKQGLYVHQSLLDVEAGLMPIYLESHIQDAIDTNTRYRGLVFATRNAEALEALTFYGGTKGYYPIYIYRGQVVSEYEKLEQLFNTGYSKLLTDIKMSRKALNLK